MTTSARALIRSASALVAAACGLLEPEQHGDPIAWVIIYGAVADPGGAPAPSGPGYGRGFRRDDCTGSVTVELSTTSDPASQCRLVLDALSTGFDGRVEMSLDGAAPPPRYRRRGVPFREAAPLDSFRVDLVGDGDG